MDSFKLSVAPHENSIPEEGKGVNTREWFFGNFGLNTENFVFNSKEKLFVISTVNNLFFYVTWKLLKVLYKFQHSVGRVFQEWWPV